VETSSWVLLGRLHSGVKKWVGKKKNKNRNKDITLQVLCTELRKTSLFLLWCSGACWLLMDPSTWVKSSCPLLFWVSVSFNISQWIHGKRIQPNISDREKWPGCLEIAVQQRRMAPYYHRGHLMISDASRSVKPLFPISLNICLGLLCSMYILGDLLQRLSVSVSFIIFLVSF
jgi:hypothetical protein